MNRIFLKMTPSHLTFIPTQPGRYVNDYSPCCKPFGVLYPSLFLRSYGMYSCIGRIGNIFSAKIIVDQCTSNDIYKAPIEI